MKNTLLIIFISLFAQYLHAQQYNIRGSNFIYAGCCENYTVTINDTISTSQGWWEITDGMGNVIDSIRTNGPRHSIRICPDEYGIYNGIIVITFNANAVGTTTTMTVQVLEPDLYLSDHYDCVIKEEANKTWVCEGTKANYFIESQVQEVYWTVTNGTIIRNDLYEIEVLWDTPGEGSIEIEAVFTDDCRHYVTVEVVVVPIPEAEFNTSPALDGNRELTICKGQNVKFINLSQNATDYQWQLGSSKSLFDFEPIYQFDKAGDYLITLITPVGCHCTDTTFATIHVTDDQAPNLTCTGTICPNEDATYYVESQCDEIIWTISGNGTIIDGGGTKDKSVTVDWGNGPIGTVTVEGVNCPPGFCSAPNLFEIPIISPNGPLEGDTEVCIGDLRQYSAPFFQGTEYYWTVETGGEIIGDPTGSNITVRWASGIAGSQKRITVNYENCYLECGGSDDLLVTILGRFQIQADPLICENEPIDASGIEVGTSNTVSCQWWIEDLLGNVIETSASNSTNYTGQSTLLPGFYTLFAQNNSGLYCDDIISFDFEVVPSPSSPLAIDGPNEVCLGGSYTFELSSPTPGLKIEWEIEDGANILSYNGPRMHASFSSPSGPYSVSARYVSPLAPHCPSPWIKSTLNSIQFTISGDNQSCVETSTLFESNRSDLTEYNWSIQPPDVGIIIAGQGTNQIEVFWAKGGSHTVNLQSCQSIQSSNIDVHEITPPKVIHPPMLCPGVTQKVTVAGTYTNIQWRNQLNQDLGTGTTIFIGPGNYHVVVTNVNGCTDSLAFQIRENPLPDATISINEERGFCETEPFSPRTIFANTNGSYTYTWFKDGVTLGPGTFSLDVTEFGTYHVIVGSAEGCSKESNRIRLFEHCDATSGGVCTGGKCRKSTCPDMIKVQFDVIDDPVFCNVKTFRDASTEHVLSFNWVVEDLINSDWVIEYDDVLTYTFPKAGYYTIYMDAWVQISPPLPDSCLTNELAIVTIPIAADFNFNQACPNDAVSFRDLSTYIPGYSIKSYSWDFGDPTSAVNSSTMQHPSHVFSGPGSYTVKLTIEETNGCLAVLEKTVVVPSPDPIDFIFPDPICAESPVHFEVVTDHFKVHWNFGDPSTLADTASSKSAYYSFDTPGSYSVTLSVEDNEGCKDQLTKTINITNPPASKNILVTGNNPYCSGEQVTLAAQEGSAWQWSTGATTQSIQVSTPGDYQVKVFFADGCHYMTPKLTLVENPLPVVTIFAEETNWSGDVFQTSISLLNICKGDLVNLKSITDQSGYSYSWSNGRNSPDVNFLNLPEGTHPFTLTCTNPTTGCIQNSNEVTVVVHPIPTAPIIVADRAMPVCEGEEVTMTIQNYDMSLNYRWNNGASSPSITVSAAGDYHVEAIGQGGCNVQSNIMTIWPVPDASKVLTGCYQRCASDTFCMPNLGDLQIQWYKDGVAIPSPEGQDPNYVIQQDGIYNIELISPNGCTDMSDDLTYEILPGFGDILITVYFDVNKNGIIDSGDTLVNNMEITTLLHDHSTRVDSTGNGGDLNFLQYEEGDYTFTITDKRFIKILGNDSVTIVGCDKRYIIELLVGEDCPTYEVNVDTTICLVDSLFFSNDTITAPGQYVITETTVLGCDSIINLDVALNDPFLFIIDSTTCKRDTVWWQGRAFDKSGLYSWQDTTIEGCLRQFQLNLSMDIAQSAIDTTICPLQELIVAGDTIATEGMTELRTTTTGGCDSIIMVNVIYNPVEIIQMDTFFCNYDTLWFEGQPYYDSGLRSWQDTTAFGCIRQIALSIDREITKVVIDTSLCAGESIDINGQTFDTTGQYSLSTTNSEGCIEEYDLDLTIDTTSSKVLITVWLDINENGLIDGPDSLLKNIPVYIENEVGTSRYGKTDTDGQWIFDDLLAGFYEIGLDTSRLDGYIIKKLSEELVFNGCGEEKELVFLLEERPKVFIPNVFTPNGDNVNDHFRLYTRWADEIVLHLSIYDRWGERVFVFDGEADQTHVVWDGRLNSRDLNPAVFVYVAEVRHRSGKSAFYSGDVTLLR